MALNVKEAGKKSVSFLQDFKAFAMKGNVMDMAVGVIIGGAFGKIVSSLVADVVMPLIGLIVGGVNFTDLKWVIRPEVLGENGEVLKAAATLNYGNFLQVTFDFLIIAFSIFAVIRVLGNLSRKKEAAPAPPAPSKEEVLLTEIRDLLKEKK
ncbi:MAG: large-conductance mechanosensitive channel protein MscL [Paludibacteraceae bacterium]|nr:large-conductance mechanosensitive channel protein MscL [Paludibacteraceae bacterium]